LNPYGILELDLDCYESDILKAYKRLSLRFHPDRAGGDAERFKQLTEARDILLDPKRRAMFDRVGVDCLDRVMETVVRLTKESLRSSESCTVRFMRSQVSDSKRQVKAEVRKVEAQLNNFRSRLERFNSDNNSVECPLASLVRSEIEAEISDGRAALSHYEHELNYLNELETQIRTLNSSPSTSPIRPTGSSIMYFS